VADIIKNLERILSHYLGAGEISEYKKLLSEFLPSYEYKGNASIKKQLEPQITASEKYQATLDTLVTFTKYKLPKNKFVEMLLHLGETSISLGENSAASKLFLYVISEVKDEPSLANLVAHSYLSLADVHSRQADWKNSIKYINLAKKIFSKQKDLKGIAKCENLLGTIEGEKGNLKKANVHFEKSLSYLDAKKDSALMGMLEINLGVLNNIQGNYDQAFTYYQRALIRYEQLENPRRIAETRHNLGMLFTQKEEYEAALKEFDQSIAVSMNSGYSPTLGLSYLSKAFIYTRLHDFMLANAFADKAMEVCTRLNDRLSIADIYKIKGIIERSQKNYNAAENYFLSSLRINQELENNLNEAETLLEMGILYQQTGSLEKAAEVLNASLKYYKKTGVADMISKINALLKANIYN